uniref:Uncharacterized protein n=1 Tax=Macrostomum lignano TaxID=282301 RepID=A0A1I8HCG5_9PLAT
MDSAAALTTAASASSPTFCPATRTAKRPKQSATAAFCAPSATCS